MARAQAPGTKSAGVGPKSTQEGDAITVPHRVLLLLVVGVRVLQEQADGVSQLGESVAQWSETEGPDGVTDSSAAGEPRALPHRAHTSHTHTPIEDRPPDGAERQAFHTTVW